MTREETISNLKAYLNGDMAVGNIIPLRSVLESAIRYLETSLPSNLDEAAEKYCESNTMLGATCRACFRDGAEWMAGQGISQDCKCIEMFQRAVGGTVNIVFPFKRLGVKDKDKVIVQIRKK